MSAFSSPFKHIRKNNASSQDDASAATKSHQVVREGKRQWEDSYRGRWAHDKVVRSTHGVNCTGSCSWNIYVKNGIVSWENQAHDYPETEEDMPDFEPRGCPRGASFSWYLYSPLRLKHPYLRSELATLWRQARQKYPHALLAWESIVSDPEKQSSYKQARGLGGFVRSTWEEVTEVIAASLLYTAYTFGPDRNFAFSVLPAMSMISFAAGARFNALMGGGQLSFYDWYADLPPASPQIWGDQTDVPESSDWYNADYLMMWGSNVPLTRTPDAHFMTEVRYKGTKVVAVSPDYAEFCEFADTWLAPHVGTDGALAMAMGHVILNEYYWKHPEPFFLDYAKHYTDMPFVVTLQKHGDHYEAGRFLNASDKGITTPNPAFDFLVFDAKSNHLVVPNGTLGKRWSDPAHWNLKLENSCTGEPLDPLLTLIAKGSTSVEVAFPAFSNEGNSVFTRMVPALPITLANGSEQLVCTVCDLLLSQYGIDRGLGGKAAQSYSDATCQFSPAWQHAITGVDPALVISTAKEFAENSLRTHGKTMIIMGAGINHWFHADTIYRTIINLLLFCAAEGRNGGGWAHYVGQEKLRPSEGWATIMTAGDWQKPPRMQNSTSFFYFASDQWRSDEIDVKDLASPLREPRYHHSADYNIMAARLGWLPAYPTFTQSGARIVADAKKTGADSDEKLTAEIVRRLKSKDLDFAYSDPDAPENIPRNLIVWRANLLGSSAKGSEYFFKYLLGAKNGIYEPETPACQPSEMHKREAYTNGKLDLLASMDFRMTTTPLYSDVILPAATWYEKTDISSTDMHPFIHPFSPAVEPGWESKTDWEAFRLLAHTVSRLAREANLEPLDDIVAVPLQHDSAGEVAQPEGHIQDWSRGECEPIPGKTMPNLVHVVRDYTQTYDKWIALGPHARSIGTTGLSWDSSEEYDLIAKRNGVITDTSLISQGCPSLFDEERAIDAVLTLSSSSNGNAAVKAFGQLEAHSGLQGLTELAREKQGFRFTYADTQTRPQPTITTPAFTGSSTHRRYTPFSTNIEHDVPFRTVTGRQSYYLDHELMQEWGESLATYKPILDYQPLKMPHVAQGSGELTLKYLTPHNKWSTHSMFFDSQQLLTLFRGGQTVWINEEDAAAIGARDNDWVELFNRNGVVTSRIATTARIPRGSVFMYHAQDRHINVPGTTLTNTRGSSHNAPTHIHLKPTHMIGAYGQLSYGFNYYGTTGNQRDILVVVRKMKEVDWLED